MAFSHLFPLTPVENAQSVGCRLWCKQHSWMSMRPSFREINPSSYSCSSLILRIVWNVQVKTDSLLFVSHPFNVESIAVEKINVCVACTPMMIHRCTEMNESFLSWTLQSCDQSVWMFFIHRLVSCIRYLQASINLIDESVSRIV
jgi:hypothetical protein